tara:strand:- start:2682 stop:3101 length:420 start_codon:yes stop_codon:yes gene_type:complete
MGDKVNPDRLDDEERTHYDKVMGDNVRGYAPLNLDDCMGMASGGDLDPENAKRVLGDVILCEVKDENDGEVMRGGIVVKSDVGTRTWRRGKVTQVGRLCQDVEVGDTVIYPSDRGLQMISASRKKYVFLNESRIFYVES